MIKRGQETAAQAVEPGIGRKVLAWDRELMMCEIRFAPGAKGALHAHPHRQVTYVAQGKLLFTLDGRQTVLSPGDSVLIPPGVPHGAEALEASLLIDVFHPCREDFIHPD